MESRTVRRSLRGFEEEGQRRAFPRTTTPVIFRLTSPYPSTIFEIAHPVDKLTVLRIVQDLHRDEDSLNSCGLNEEGRKRDRWCAPYS